MASGRASTERFPSITSTDFGLAMIEKFGSDEIHTLQHKPELKGISTDIDAVHFSDCEIRPRTFKNTLNAGVIEDRVQETLNCFQYGSQGSTYLNIWAHLNQDSSKSHLGSFSGLEYTTEQGELDETNINDYISLRTNQLKNANSVAGLQLIVNKELTTSVNNQLRRLKHLTYAEQSIRDRIQSQFTFIYSLIAQRDTKVSIEIAAASKALAAASKQDSSTMKTLGALGAVFLPPTFVAGLFAMPLFDWDAVSSRGIISGRMWIYWTVTVPLTLFVVLVWWISRRFDRQNDPKPKFEYLINMGYSI